MIIDHQAEGDSGFGCFLSLKFFFPKCGYIMILKVYLIVVA